MRRPPAKGEIDPASFRDPSGYVFYDEGTLYRQVNRCYRENFELLCDSGLYNRLISLGLLITHENTDLPARGDDGYVVIKPQLIPFISYPYEWSFGQLKAAALATLRIQMEAMSYGQSLKDASAYNIQFVGSKPVLLDTLSFERIEEGKPWVAYRQFCQHFLAPLALMARTDTRLSHFLRVFVDGIPLDLASRLLPRKTKLSFSLGTHIHLHAKSQSKYAGRRTSSVKGTMSRRALTGLIDSLYSACEKLEWDLPKTVWGDYYNDTNYSETAAGHKQRIVKSMAEQAGPKTAWDLGANDGRYSRVLSEMGITTVAFDVDPVAVEKNWREVVRNGETRLLPLVSDLTNPSSGMGWAGEERRSLVNRGPADLVMGLALIHHLAIGNNVPFNMIARFFSSLGEWLIVEFVPKDDSQVQRLLASREDIFTQYDEDHFRTAFSEYYDMVRRDTIKESMRAIYLMKRREVV